MCDLKAAAFACGHAPASSVHFCSAAGESGTRCSASSIKEALPRSRWLCKECAPIQIFEGESMGTNNSLQLLKNVGQDADKQSLKIVD
jgi:hypothetical protein